MVRSDAQLHNVDQLLRRIVHQRLAEASYFETVHAAIDRRAGDTHSRAPREAAMRPKADIRTCVQRHQLHCGVISHTHLQRQWLLTEHCVAVDVERRRASIASRSEAQPSASREEEAGSGALELRVPKGRRYSAQHRVRIRAQRSVSSSLDAPWDAACVEAASLIDVQDCSGRRLLLRLIPHWRSS